MEHEAIREAAVIAVPHPKWQERPLAVLILKDGSAVDACELRIFLERRFARWQVPDAFVFVNQLPYTSTGKLLKSKLRSDFIDLGVGSRITPSIASGFTSALRAWNKWHGIVSFSLQSEAGAITENTSKPLGR